jgi:iron-sulfur cluster repair protein YtfE (RIC family)
VQTLLDLPLTQPLRDEHRDLLPHIESLRTVADMVDSATDADLLEALAEVSDFLTAELAPHAEAEESVMYPAVEQALASPRATETMRRDHVEIVGLIKELQRERALLSTTADPATPRRALRAVLLGLHAVVRLHFAKEEELYLPALDAWLSPSRASSLFAAMEATARVAHARLAREARSRAIA